MAQCVVHVLKGLAYRAPGLFALAEVTIHKLFFNESNTEVLTGVIYL